MAIVAGSGGRGVFVLLVAAAVPRIPDAPVVGADVARSAPARNGSDPADSRRLGGRTYGRPAALPDAAEPLQRAQLIAALLVGTEIIQLCHFCRRFELGSGLDAALDAFAQGNSATAIARLADVDRALTSGSDAAALRARSNILGISETLTRHAAYFAVGEPG